MASSVPLNVLKEKTNKLYSSLPNPKELNDVLITTWKETHAPVDAAGGIPDISEDIIMRYILYLLLLGIYRQDETNSTSTTPFSEVVQTGLNTNMLDEKYAKKLTDLDSLPNTDDNSKYEDDFSSIISLLGKETYIKDLNTVIFGVVSIEEQKTSIDAEIQAIKKYINNTVVLNMNAVYNVKRDESRIPGDDIYQNNKSIVYYNNYENVPIVIKDVDLRSGNNFTYDNYYTKLQITRN